MIMNKAAWASAHGLSVVDGGVQGPAVPTPEGASEPDPVAAVQALEAELRAAQAEIQRQAGLIRQLQEALRSEIAKNRPPQAQKLGGATPPPAIRVVRRRRSAEPASPSTTKE